MNNAATPNRSMTASTIVPMNNPAIVAVMGEGAIVHPMIARMEPLVAAVKGANADLGIAMWVRFRQIMLDANRDMRLETAAIAKAASSESVTVDGFDLDAVIATLPTHSPLLQSIGRFRAAAFLVGCFETAQAIERAPTLVMKRVLATVVAHHARLLDDLNRMINAELDIHATVVGKRAAQGEVSVRLSRNEAVPSTIVIEH